MRSLRRSIVFGFALAAATTSFVSTIEAKNLFVDNSAGDDRNNGLEERSSVEAGPVRTIRRALQLTEPGDFVILKNTGSPYRESITLSGSGNSGFSIQPFTLVGNGAVLDGSRPMPKESWENVRPGLFRARPPRGGYYRLFLAGKPAVKRPVDPAVGQLPKLAEGEWCVREGYVYFATSLDKSPHEYDLSYAAETVGITLYQVHDVAILDLTVQGFHTDGVNAHDSAKDVRLGGLILRGNGRAGLAVGGSSQVAADGCLMGDNGEEQVFLNGYGTLSLQLCELLDASAPKLTRRGGRLFIDGERQE